MIIKTVEPFVLHIPVTGGGISDSTHSITHWGVVGARIRTSEGLEGWGFTGTHAYLPGDRLIATCIRDCYAHLLIGESTLKIEMLHNKLAKFAPMQWIGRAGISQLAISALDTALWDLKAKSFKVPLWKLLGGDGETNVSAYSTDAGWLSLSLGELLERTRRAVEEDGFTGIKIKVGSADWKDDIKRLEAVRNAIGPDIMLAVDVNGKWDLKSCVAFCKEAESSNVQWIEEPLWYDDVIGHVELARQIKIPVALGEQLYTFHAFQTFMDAGAVHYVQPDITRLAGISEYLQVSDAARNRGLPVAPHVGDMGQVHVHLAMSDPGCSILEYIPWIKDAFEEPIRVEGGVYVRPNHPGAGTTPTSRALEQFSKALV